MDVENEKDPETVIEEKIDAIYAETETLRGDVRDAMLDRIKNLQHPWPIMKQAEQQTIINGCEAAAENLVRTVVDMVVRFGFPAVEGILVKTNIKDVMQCQIDVFRSHPRRDALLDHLGMKVMIVLADAESFMGQSQEAKPDPDQSNMFDSSKAREDKD